ncbi:hypothetical protein B9Z19DRAFT_1154381 [Tuber borchii]|uniref:Uncharacterized protein n=1 Tax=Tuber borchii TaxID=42251 RepID=A0A2T7A4K7_TUBBO|nr:hypothetical protein B9Z19DRAFT_1154381 [Tuber borchii]
MAPLPDPSLQSTIYSIYKKISSFLKKNPKLSPASITDPVEVASVQTTGWEAPSLVPTTPISSELPSSNKTETWSEITNSQKPNGLVEFDSDKWKNSNSKRSIDTQEPPMTAMDGAGINAQVAQVPEGEYDFLYSQELRYPIFIYFVVVLMAIASILFMTQIAGRVNRRITRCPIELSGDCLRRSFLVYSHPPLRV